MYATLDFAKPAKSERKTGMCASPTCKRTNISGRCLHHLCAACCRLEPAPCGYGPHNQQRHNAPVQSGSHPAPAPFVLDRPLPTVPYDPLPPSSSAPLPTQPDSPPNDSHLDEQSHQSAPAQRVLRVPMDKEFQAAWDKARVDRVKALEGGDLLRQNMAALAQACVLMYWSAVRPTLWSSCVHN